MSDVNPYISIERADFEKLNTLVSDSLAKAEEAKALMDAVIEYQNSERNPEK